MYTYDEDQMYSWPMHLEIQQRVGLYGVVTLFYLSVILHLNKMDV